MRNGQNNKRMRGRNRNNNNNNNNNNNSSPNRGHHQNPLTRVYESNGQDVKIRGTAHTVAEKYLQLARDAAMAGDHVTAENHHQHAEHYLRVIAAAQEQFRQQNPYYQPQQAAPSADSNDGPFDDDGDDGQQQGQPQHGQPQQAQPQQNQQPQQSPPQQSQPQQQQPNYGNHQPSYPPREQPQPYIPQQPQHQPRPQHQPQHQPQPPSSFEGNNGLPSFITGAQPSIQQPDSQNGQGGHDSADGDRFPLHRRRRRHRGPRPETGSPDFQRDPVTE